MSTEKLYPIRPDLGDFRELSSYYPGVTHDGTQVLIYAQSPKLYAFRFDPAGHYQGVETREMIDWPADGPPAQRRNARLSNVLTWAGEIGLTPATIHVRKFSSGHEPPGIFIADVPSRFEDDDLATLGTDEEREELFRWWRDLGAFVLWCAGTEYTLDGTGTRFQ